MKKADEIKSVDNYIASADPAVRPALKKIRMLVKSAVPAAQETISYKIPAFKLKRTFFYYAAFKQYVGIYPPVKNNKQLIKELRPYANEKGNLKFPLDHPVPYDLIERVAVALSTQYEGDQ